MKAEPKQQAAALWQIEAAGLAQNSPTAWTPAEYEAELQNPDAQVFLWPSATAATGFVLWRVVVDEAWLMQLAVREKGCGQGRALMSAFLQSLNTHNELRSVGLEVRATNAAARRLYEGLGFQVIGQRAKYYRDGDDAIVYKLAIHGSAGEG